MRIVFYIFTCLAVCGGLPNAVSQGKPADPAQGLLQTLENDFRDRLADPAAYQKQVESECSRQFPEGNLFPYLMPAMSFCYLIESKPDANRRAELLALAGKCIRMAADSVAKKLNTTSDKLDQISSYQNQGTYVGQFALALAVYRNVGGKDADLLKVEAHFCKILADAFEKSKGKPLDSYPGLIWPFDSTPALLAIKIHDQTMKTDVASALIKKHREWMLKNGVDERYGLPLSRIFAKTKAKVPPRGCDLSWRLALWKSLDPDLGKAWYSIYRREFWQNAGLMVGGFREWPKSEGNRAADVDSGPIVYGIGATASVLGLMVTSAYDDRSARASLMSQANLLIQARKDESAGGTELRKILDGALRDQGIAVSETCRTGFLFGDVTLFYALAWRPLVIRN